MKSSFSKLTQVSLPLPLPVLTLILSLAVALSLSGCSEEIAKPVRSDTIADAPEVPQNLQTFVGDAEIRLTWTVGNPASISRFLIYRGDTASVEPELIDSTTQTVFVDRKLRNGLRYIYQVSSIGINQLESRRSRPAAAMPHTFAISINDGARYTNRRDVTISIAAPGGVRLLQLSDDDLFSGAQWVNFSATKSWTLPIGDGVKTVYARFRDLEGNETDGIVSDDIILDTQASIKSVTENSGGAVLSAGSTIRITLDSGETEGQAWVEVAGLGRIDLYDVDPGDGGQQPDGIYQALYVVPGAVDVIDATVTGHFIDAAGNNALPRAATTLINIANPPPPATLSAFVVSESEVELAWTRSSATDFARYLLFRSETSNVGFNSVLVLSQPSAVSTTYRDSDLEPDKTYYYALFTVDASGLSSKSNEVQTKTLTNQPPEAVSLFVSDQDSTSITLGWTPSDEDDFASYRIYRSATTPVNINLAGNLTGVVTSRTTLTFTDKNVSQGQEFYYVVVVYDRYGARSSASNEVRGPNP